VYGFLESAHLGWRNPVVYGSLIGGLICLVGFVYVEARGASPMVPLSLYKSRSFSGANLLTLLLYSALGIFFFLFPLNLIQVQGYSATAAGAAAIPMILTMFLFSRWAGGLVTRYGPRAPLVCGPLIAAVGFAMFAIPSVGGSYWKTMFPAILVLGAGMTITVAPLTTVVMTSVNQDRVGTASGINNAVSRVAGVLAIAVFGVVMVNAFSWRLNQDLAQLSLPAGVVQEIRAQGIKLAGLEVPEDVDHGTKVVVKQAVGAAFVFGFRIVILICAVMAGASALVAWMMIPPRISAQP
jgi:predicted MFS family arabinose efflux permease